MSVSFDIQASTGTYSIVVKNGLFSDVLGGRSHSAVIADEHFGPALRRAGIDSITVSATEKAKSMDAMAPIIQEMRSRGANRQTELISIGGGVVQDISAFIASVYMRGLTWTYIPTTLLSMVDSCVGGKSSINVGPYKNLVGTFHPPKTVLIDPALTATLSIEQQAGGLVEAAKICFCRGEEAFAQYLSCGPGSTMTVEAIERVIVGSLRAKKWFIEIDEFDKAERLLLNFGHTFGHAMEGASHFRITHGVAVALGILCALEFERRRGIDYSAINRVKDLENHLTELLRTVPNLRQHLSELTRREVIERFESDKKHGHEYYTLVLVSEIGEVVLRKFDKSQRVRDQIEAAIDSVAETTVL